ncbi:MAG: efflux RND transporter permease subunit, partial [Candidatus Hydrogenedentota bacterium]
LEDLGNQALAAIHDIRGIKDAELSLKRGYPEVHVLLDRELLGAKNIQPIQVAQLLRTEVQGDVATQFNRGGEKVDIRVRSDQARMTSIDDLKMLSVTEGDPPTPLMSVARIVETDGPSEIRRIDQRQVVLVTANVEGRDLGSVASDIRARMETIAWGDGYEYVLGGQNRELESSYGGLLFAIALAIFLVYVVMACQFESIVHPMFIMFSVPLAFIGVVYALAWLNQSVSIIVFIGGIVLAGIVVNSAIILVDYINQLRARGHSKIDAIVEAGTVRFRPIMMTAATTVLGLIPMALSSGEGAEIRSPMAITVMSGLISSTVLTLFIIPVIYYMFASRDKA